MSEPEAPKAREEGAGAERSSLLEDHVIPALKEPMLGPVWIVVVAHLAAFGAWSILVALEQGRISAYLGAFGLFWLTGTAGVMEIRQRGGPGALCAMVAFLWALTVAFVWGARHWGIF